MPRTKGQKLAIALPLIVVLCSASIVAEDWLTRGTLNTSYLIMGAIALVLLWIKIRETRE